MSANEPQIYATKVLSDGSKFWFKNGLLHRDHDLPAIEYENGEKQWWRHGKCHRDHDLPAIIRANVKIWFQHDKILRDDGPVIEYSSGGCQKKWYYID